MRVHKMKSGGCKKCGNWTGHGHRKLCVDCARKKPALGPCQYLGCTSITEKRGVKYCMNHRGLRNYPVANV